MKREGQGGMVVSFVLSLISFLNEVFIFLLAAIFCG